MVKNILRHVKSGVLRRINVIFNIQKINFDSMVGRTAHILFLDNQDLMRAILYTEPELLAWSHTSLIITLYYLNLYVTLFLKKDHFFIHTRIKMHRPGIEPGSTAWKAIILPLNHRCLSTLTLIFHNLRPNFVFLVIILDKYKMCLQKNSYFFLFIHLTSIYLGKQNAINLLC